MARHRRDRVAELAHTAGGQLANRQPARRRHVPVGVPAGDVLASDEVDRRRRTADIGRARPAGAAGRLRAAAQISQLVVGDRALGHRPGHATGAVEVLRPARPELEPAWVIRDVPVERETGIVAGRRAGDLLLDRDRPARRRRRDIQAVAEHVPNARREEDELDVVAVQVVGRAAQPTEPVRRTGELLRQVRVGRSSALRPQLAGLTRLRALLRGQLNRHRPRQLLLAHRQGVLIQQRRLRPSYDRSSRKRVRGSTATPTARSPCDSATPSRA